MTSNLFGLCTSGKFIIAPALKKVKEHIANHERIKKFLLRVGSENSIDNFFSPFLVIYKDSEESNFFDRVQMFISLEAHITCDCPGGVWTTYPL